LLQAAVRRGGERHVVPLVLSAGREEEDRHRVAKERLQIILAHERSGPRRIAEPDYLPAACSAELVAVISQVRARSIARATSRSAWRSQDNFEVLEVKIELPDAR
jgi:cell division topological specificity factor